MHRKILIADQSETVRGIAENLFRKKGFEVVSASDGIEALELVKTAGVDLALLNSSLPEIDGYSVSRQVKLDESTENVKVVLLLSTSEIVEQHRLLASLADDTINKPFSPQDLIETASLALNVEIEEADDDEPGEDGGEMIGDDIEEIGFDKMIEDEIDFSSIFGNGKQAEEPSATDSVFLSEENSDDADAGRDPGTRDGARTDTGRGKHVKAGRSANEADDRIRLADDQYDLENSRPGEVEAPHDYNWFIREMKKDLKKPDESKFSGPAKASASLDHGRHETERAVPGKPQGHSASAGHFATEEIGTSKIRLGVAEPEGQGDFDLSTDPADESSAGRLALAEKLLIRELAAKIAENLVKRIPGTELKQIIADALSNLKRI